jgi:hypothetical protein
MTPTARRTTGRFSGRLIDQNLPCGVKATERRRSACDCGELGNSRGTFGFFQRGGRTGGAVSAGDRPELERAAALKVTYRTSYPLYRTREKRHCERAVCPVLHEIQFVEIKPDLVPTAHERSSCGPLPGPSLL